MDRLAHRGRWRAKRGTLPKLSTFLSQLEVGPFGEKTNFRKKVSQCRKTERGTGPFEIFKHIICCKISKKLKGPFGEKQILEKSLTMPKKTERGDPLGFFNIHSVAKHQKIEGGKKFPKKSRSAEKKLKGGALWSRPVWYVKRKNLFGSVR